MISLLILFFQIIPCIKAKLRLKRSLWIAFIKLFHDVSLFAKILAVGQGRKVRLDRLKISFQFFDHRQILGLLFKIQFFLAESLNCFLMVL
jgi:hypothetical protein